MTEIDHIKQTKIIIVEDHPLMSQGVKSNFEGIENVEVVHIASNGKAALDYIKSHPVDLVMMDVEMPIMNGIECSKILRKSHPDLSIIVLSMFEEKGLVEDFISIGIKGYLPKTTTRDELLKAVNIVLGGDSYFSNELFSDLNNETKSNLSMVPSFQVAPEATKLTEREKEVITLISKGYSNSEMASMLFISTRTVETHRSNIMKKTKTGKVAELIRFSFKNGIL